MRPSPGSRRAWRRSAIPRSTCSTSFVLRNAGLVALARDNTQHAESYFGRALEAAREERQTYAELGALLAQTQLCLRSRQPAAAARTLADALPIARRVEGVLAHIRTVEHAACVLGGTTGAPLAHAAALCRERLDLPRWPSEQALMASFDEPPADAPRLSIQQALQRANELVRERVRGGSHLPPVAEQLTPREWEVAQLIARGFSTREVADALTISGGTARAHVDRIRTKLGYISRAEIATRLALSQT